MLDLFRQLKLEYKDYLILFKSGSFYISFDEDALILNKLFDYKLNELKNNLKVGFPLFSFDKVITVVSDNKINYLVIEDRKIVDKEKYKYNNFNKYTSSVFNLVSINSRINSISKKIRSIDDLDKINYILDKVEELINE